MTGRFVCALACAVFAVAAAPDPEAVFRHPPLRARTGVWWHWMGSNVTKEGIVKDLDWFKEVTWGELNPVTRSVPSGKTYNRKKEKQRTGKEFRNGFDAGFNIILDRNHEGIENAQFNT